MQLYKTPASSPLQVLVPPSDPNSQLIQLQHDCLENACQWAIPFSMHISESSSIMYQKDQNEQPSYSTLQCRRCNLCIMDMDHHCFFLNKCVGRNNLKPFLLFLSWLLLGALYTIIAASSLLHQRWGEVQKHIGILDLDHRLFLWGMRIYFTVVFAPNWVQICVFLLSTATGAALGVTKLLQSQVSLVLAGKTYVGSLQHQHNSAWQQHISCSQWLQAILQNMSWTWLWPCGLYKGKRRPT